MPRLPYAQLRYLAIILSAWLTVFFLTRSLLLLGHLGDVAVGPADMLAVFGIGLVYDLGFLFLASLPLAAYVAICPPSLWRNPWHRRFLNALVAAGLFVMLFVAVAEWLFWDEFGVRFNFIAVDYLIYSDEVVHNILESYPVAPLLGALAVLALVVAVLLRRPLAAAHRAPLLSRTGRFATLAACGVLAAATVLTLTQEFPRGSGGNAYVRELASNGPYQFFAAFRNNELDYSQFYATLPADRTGRSLREEVFEPNARFLGSDPLDIRRVIDNPGPPRRLNVILVTIESLSAKYLGSFGDPRNLTPNLDRLRGESLFFTNFYATGTRTDRGLEALTLSVPPTPGRSIVKRIGREKGFASLGRQLQDKGYDSNAVKLSNVAAITQPCRRDAVLA